MRDTFTSVKLSTYWRRPLFAIDGAEVHGIDVALAAMARGAWSPFERRVAEGLACVAWAERGRLLPSPEEVDAAAEAFRYDRDLIAADDMHDWLDRADVTTDEWQAYLVRDLLRDAAQPQADDVLDQFPPSSRSVVDAAYVEGVCSGVFDRFGRAYAEQAALVASLPSSPPQPADRQAALDVAHSHAHWLADWPADEVAARLERVLAVAAAFERAASDLASPDRLAEIVAQHQVDWRLIETDSLTLATEHAAREALLCVSADRLSLHDVAALCRRSATRDERFHDELDDEVRDRLAVLDSGTAAGPFAVNGHFAVTVVRRHQAPSLSDPRVAARARSVLIERAAALAAQDHVRPVEDL